MNSFLQLSFQFSQVFVTFHPASLEITCGFVTKSKVSTKALSDFGYIVSSQPKNVGPSAEICSHRTD